MCCLLFQSRRASACTCTQNRAWGELLPLSRAFLSTQSPMMAPSSSTDPATTKPYTAVRSKLFPYNSTRNTATAKFHMRSPCRTKQQQGQFISEKLDMIMGCQYFYISIIIHWILSCFPAHISGNTGFFLLLLFLNKWIFHQKIKCPTDLFA